MSTHILRKQIKCHNYTIQNLCNNLKTRNDYMYVASTSSFISSQDIIECLQCFAVFIVIIDCKIHIQEEEKNVILANLERAIKHTLCLYNDLLKTVGQTYGLSKKREKNYIKILKHFKDNKDNPLSKITYTFKEIK